MPSGSRTGTWKHKRKPQVWKWLSDNHQQILDQGERIWFTLTFDIKERGQWVVFVNDGEMEKGDSLVALYKYQ